MPTYNIAETFLSINGEGTHAGQLAFFIRFTGCNLRCGYCDTKWAQTVSATRAHLSAEELYRQAKESGANNVTVTGGEPMLQPDVEELLNLLCRDPELYVEVETNGSIDLTPYLKKSFRPSFTMDYKLPASGMEHHMFLPNLPRLTKKDTVKFVCGGLDDLERAWEIIREYDLTHHTCVYLSPVFGAIQPADMVEFMKQHHMTGVTLQIQLHKVIWDPNRQGV